MKNQIELRRAVRKIIMEYYGENETVEEGIGKYLAGAALAASLASAPMKGAAQTPVKDFAKDKIAMVGDKVKDVRGDVKDFAKDQIAGAKEKLSGIFHKKQDDHEIKNVGRSSGASLDSLRKKAGTIEKMNVGENRYIVTAEGVSPSQSFAKDIALNKAKSLMAQKVKGKEVSPGTTYSSAKLSDGRVHEERLFQNEDGSYSYFITISYEVN